MPSSKGGLVETQQRSGEVKYPLNRRDFLRTTAVGLAGISGVLALQQSPVLAQAREISLPSFNNYVSAADDKLREQATAFSKQRGVKVHVDTIAHLQIPAKIAAEVQTQAGHDLIVLLRSHPHLYKNHLVPLNDMAERLGSGHGGWYDWARDTTFIDGHWRALYWLSAPFPGLYNKRYFDEASLPTPDTWGDVLKAGRVLKPRGHPVGIAISHCGDANVTFWSILWGHGGKVVEPDGRTLAMRTPEMKATIEYYKALYQEAMTDEVLSWDDASNNRCLVSGHCAWIHNPISAYETARTKDMPIHHDLYLHSSPAGPSGRYWCIWGASLGIWRFSKQIDLAQDFLAYLFAEEQYSAWITASEGFMHAALRDYETHPIWQKNPKFAILPQEAPYGRTPGWPAKPNEFIQIVEDLYVLPDMVAKAVTGTSIETAIQWGEEQVRKVLEGKAG
jgi:multiple sugar transport system substrate-binding protein